MPHLFFFFLSTLSLWELDICEHSHHGTWFEVLLIMLTSSFDMLYIEYVVKECLDKCWLHILKWNHLPYFWLLLFYAENY